ncbi:GNAT family N-acetyltransferase [Marinicrinis sediminis]|uniref:Enhanced intracellular survival protein Eis n=1 Tax=Marinicrinis sediminis TaxID=1652465 RepID=A0ABW5R6S7_9BACL
MTTKINEMNTYIRSLRYEEMDQAIELSGFAFQHTITPEVRAMRRKMIPSSSVRGIFRKEDDTLLGKLTLLDLQVYVGEKVLDMGGIAGVATWPEYRRLGLVRQLLAHSLREMREKGLTLSMLHPFSFSFYRKYGWETFVDRKICTLKMAQVPVYSANGSEGQWVRLAASEEAWTAMQDVYDRVARHYNGTLVRTGMWWQERVFQSGSIKYVYERAHEGDASTEGEGSGKEEKVREAFLEYEVRDRKMKVYASGYTTEAGRRAIWQFIAQHDSMADEIEIEVPANEDMTYGLDDPKFKQEITPYFMARIVDMEGFLRQYPFQPGSACQLVLEVVDTFADWNNGAYLLELDEAGHVAIVQISEERSLERSGHDEATLPVIRGAIPDITAWLLGYRHGVELYKRQLITGDEQAVQVLSSRLSGHSTYLPDFF